MAKATTKKAGKTRTKPMGADTEARILDVAITIFAENGYELTSMRDIADATQLTPASIYLYYDDKEKLYEAACRACFDRSTAAILAFVDPTASASRQLYDFIRGMAITLVDDQNATRLFEREVIASSRTNLARSGTAFRASFGKAQELVSRAMGEDDAPTNAASLFALTLGLIQFSHLLTIMEGPILPLHGDGEKLAQHVMDIMLPHWRTWLG